MTSQLQLYDSGLIVFPYMIDRKVIIQKIISSPMTIITDDCENTFPNILFVKYSDIDTIRRSLNQHSIIIFDNARMFSIILPILDIKNISCKIFILTTWGDLNPQTLLNLFPNLWRYLIPSPSYKIEWLYIKVPLSPKQLEHYSYIKSLENESNVKNISYPMTRKITLYLDNKSQLCNSTNLCPIISKDDFELNSIQSNSPKLYNLYQNIDSYRSVKQIVLTQYHIEVLSNVLQSFDPIVVSSLNNENDVKNKLDLFNQEESSILLTNITPYISLKNVSIIHIVDNYAFPSIVALLNKCYKQNLKIYIYVGTIKDEISSDEALFNDLINNIYYAHNTYDHLIESSIDMKL